MLKVICGGAGVLVFIFLKFVSDVVALLQKDDAIDIIDCSLANLELLLSAKGIVFYSSTKMEDGYNG